MESNFLKISKLEAAESQLVQSIRLFFSYGDAVSTHTLAASAYQIIIDICKLKGVYRTIEDTSMFDGTPYKKDLIQAFRKPQNFFKHANQDPDEVIEFNPDMTPYIMYLAQSYYQQLTGKIVGEFQAIQAWVICKHKSIAPKDVAKKLDALNFIPSIEDFSFWLEFADSYPKHKPPLP